MGVAVSLAGLLAYAGVVYVAVFRAGPQRRPALVAYLLNCAVGVAVVLAPNGLEDSSGDSARLATGLLAAVASGGAIGYVRLRAISARVLAAAVLGAAAFIGGLLFLLVFGLSVSGSCLD